MKKIFTYILFFFSFSVFCINSYFLNMKNENSFPQAVKTKSIRNIASSHAKSTDSLSFPENQLWKRISLFENSNPSLYQFIGNPNLFISVQRAKGVSIKQISDLNHFLKQREQEKAIILSKTSISDRKISSSKMENANKKAALSYSEGTYVDSQKKLVFFKDWCFYHNKLSVYIVVHSTQHLTEQESQAVYTFIHNTIQLEPSFTTKDKKLLLTLLNK